jgi:hypothetical protein
LREVQSEEFLNTQLDAFFENAAATSNSKARTHRKMVQIKKRKLMISIQHLKRISIAVLLLTVFSATSAVAQDGPPFVTKSDIDAELLPRLAQSEAEFSMTTKEGSVEMLILDTAIYMQFSDRFMEDLEKEINEEESDDSAFAEAIKAAVTSGVRSMLNRSLVIPISQISEMGYENGRLIMKDYDGEELFEDLDINGVEVMEDFRPRDARKFISIAEKRMI